MISEIINNYVIVGIWEIVEKTIGFCSEVKEAIAEHKQVPQPENKGCNTPMGAISQQNPAIPMCQLPFFVWKSLKTIVV